MQHEENRDDDPQGGNGHLQNAVTAPGTTVFTYVLCACMGRNHSESRLCSLVSFCSSLIRSSIIVPTWQGGNGQSGEGMPASWSGSRPCVCSHCAMQQPCWVSPGTPCGPCPCSGGFVASWLGSLALAAASSLRGLSSRFSSAPFERNVTDGVTGMAQGSLGALSEVCNHGLIRADRNVQASPRCEKAREKMANQGTEKQ